MAKDVNELKVELETAQLELAIAKAKRELAILNTNESETADTIDAMDLPTLRSFAKGYLRKHGK